MAKEDELLDLVDKNDQVIGTIMRSQSMLVHREGKGYLRAAELFIRDKEGKLWIPRRSMKKSIAPGGLDYSASGHVALGESYEEALRREVKEELNLDIKPELLRLIHKFPPIGDEPKFFRAVYIYESDEAPNFNREDFTEYYWLTPQELLAKLEAGEPAKRSLKETVKYLVERTS